GEKMVWYAPKILNLFGAPELSNLTSCGAKELPALPDYLSVAMLNYISGVPSSPDPAVHHLDLAFLRRSHAAAEEYRLGRERRIRYVEGVASGSHLLGAYLSALTHFEQCLGAIWQAAELFERMRKKVQGDMSTKMALYEKGQRSDLERINDLNNVAKHFNRAKQKNHRRQSGSQTTQQTPPPPCTSPFTTSPTTSQPP